MNYRIEVMIGGNKMTNAEFFWLLDAQDYKDKLQKRYKEEGSSSIIQVILSDIKSGRELT